MSDQVMDSQMKNESLSSDREADKMGDNDSELNCRQIVCKRCSSVILRAKQAKLLDKEIQLPVISKEKKDEEENFNRVLLVDDMYTFENMGFSNTLKNRKYLVCADCEHGPIGFMTNEDKKSYVALDRVDEKD